MGEAKEKKKETEQEESCGLSVSQWTSMLRKSSPLHDVEVLRTMYEQGRSELVMKFMLKLKDSLKDIFSIAEQT